MARIVEIKREVLRRVKPTREEVERLRQLTMKILEIAAKHSERYGYIGATPVGSTARGTWLKGDSDIDVFLLFPKDLTREELGRKGLAAARAILRDLNGKGELKYAEHPYLSAKIEGYDVDLVPCYKIEPGERIISAVDRSPLHNAYVLQNLDPSLRDEVRVLKQFCKGIGIYGSDLKTCGVSGYLCELLVIHFGKFENVIKNVANLKPVAIIDVSRRWFKSEDELRRYEKELQEMFKGEPLIVIDPVDPKRNVAAALSCENFAKFVTKAKEFLAAPSLDYFFPKKRPLTRREVELLKARETHFLGLRFRRPNIVDDVLYPQLRKTLRRLATSMRIHGFEVIRKYEFVSERTGQVMLIFELKYGKQPAIEKRVGPSIFVSPNREDFLRKYSSPPFGPYLEEDKLVVERETEFKTVEELLNQRYLKLSPRELMAKGIPSEVAKALPKAELISGKTFFDLVERDGELSIFLREKYIETRLGV